MKFENVAKALFVLTALLASLNLSAGDFKQDAQQCLNNLDSAKYGESWEQAGVLFKSQISKADWEKSAKAARVPMGKLILRQMKNAQAYTELPGAPDGNYMVIQYASSFKNKKSAVETLTLSKAGDKWRMVGYFIK